MKNIGKQLILIGASIAATMLLSAFTATTYALTFTVNSTAGDNDGSCADIDCTFLDAVSYVNSGTGGDTIDLTGVTGEISLSTNFTITKDNTTILGDTDVSVTGPEGPWLMELDSDGNMVNGLVMYTAGSEEGDMTIWIGGDNNTIKNSHIATNAAGSAHAGAPMAIQVEGDDNNIGTGVEGEGNVLGGEVWVMGSGTLIAGNLIQVGPNGEDISPVASNTANVIHIASTVTDITIGGSSASYRNVMGYNDYPVIGITGGNDPSSVINIFGNYIGVTPDGNSAASISTGINVQMDTAGTINIGSSTEGTGNVISGGAGGGAGAIAVGAGSSPVVSADINIKRNHIGTNASGTSALSNVYGIVLRNVTGTINIGPERNTISGNTVTGIMITDGDTGTLNVYGNYIGLGDDGSTIIANARGVEIGGGATVNIGNAGNENRNVISGNTGNGNGTGIITYSDLTGDISIFNNYIGVDATGSTAKPNHDGGIIAQSPVNIESNVISGNMYEEEGDDGGVGIYLMGVTGANIYSNKIGTDATGALPIPNTGKGIEISSGSTGILIGNTAEDGNIISYNLSNGIMIRDGSSAIIKNNTIEGNGGVEQMSCGIEIGSGANTVTIGSAGNGNTISGNYGTGISVASSSNVTIQGNTISNGASMGDPLIEDLANGDGIFISDIGSEAPLGTILIGGEEAGQGNTIISNEENGISIFHLDAEIDGEPLVGIGIENVSILGNYIGTNTDGDDLGNSNAGIYVYNMENSDLINSLTVGSESGPNTIKYNQHGLSLKLLSAGTEGSPNVFNYNIIANNTLNGVYNIGSSPFITNNTISDNTSHGILNWAYFGVEEGPLTIDETDDILATPTISGNTFSGNGGSDIIDIDTDSGDASTLTSGNTFSGGSGARIMRYWIAVLEVLDGNGDPITTGVTATIPNATTMGGPAGDFNAYSNGAWGPAGFDYNDLRTWAFVPEVLVDSDGDETDYNPTTVTAVVTTPSGTYTAEYDFNGQSHTETGKGLPIDRNGRYQIAEIIVDDSGDDGDGGNNGGGAIILHYSNPAPKEPTDDNEDDTDQDTDQNEDNKGTEDIAKQVVDTVDQVQTQAEIDKAAEKAANGEKLTKEEKAVLAEQKTVETVQTDVEKLLNLELTSPDNGATSPENSDTEQYQQILDSAKEIFAGSADADGDGISNAQEIRNGTDPLLNNKGTITQLFSPSSKTGESTGSSIGRLKVAGVSSNGFVLTGTTKPNTEVTVKAGGNTFKVTSDANGHYLVPVELTNIALNSLVAVETDADGQKTKILAKVEKDTIPAPTFSLEGKNVAQIKDFKAAELIDYLAGLNPEWVKRAVISALNYLANTEYKDTVIARLEIQIGNGMKMIVKGTATPGSTVVLAYKSVIYSSVVIADKNGNFTAELPKDLTAELTKNKDLKEIQHELISFAVDYKTNKISPFAKGFLKLFQ